MGACAPLGGGEVKIKKIRRNQVAMPLPGLLTTVGWLLFDRIGIPSWGWGVFWTIFALLWASAIYDVIVSEPVTLDLEKLAKEAGK